MLTALGKEIFDFGQLTWKMRVNTQRIHKEIQASGYGCCKLSRLWETLRYHSRTQLEPG